jgi:hypothetical protein
MKFQIGQQVIYQGEIWKIEKHYGNNVYLIGSDTAFCDMVHSSQMRKTMVTFGGNEIKPVVGLSVKPDEWGYSSPLLPGDSFSTFRIGLHSGGPIESLAVEIEVTGRTVQRKTGGYFIRVKITFPGDCESDTVTRGWMRID